MENLDFWTLEIKGGDIANKVLNHMSIGYQLSNQCSPTKHQGLVNRKNI